LRGVSASGDELKPLDGADALGGEHALTQELYGGGEGGDALAGLDMRLAQEQGMPVAPDGVAAFDPATSLRLLEASFRCMPQPADSQLARRGRARNLVPVPPSFPTVLPPVMENPALFERLDADALFFSFYFQQARCVVRVRRAVRCCVLTQCLHYTGYPAAIPGGARAEALQLALPQKVQHLVRARGGAQGVHGGVRAGRVCLL
jgi:hypothetical protein